MLAVKNFFLPERTKAPDTPQRFSRMPEAFLRSIRRRSLRVKRAKSLVVPDREKRKSGEVECCEYMKNNNIHYKEIFIKSYKENLT